MISGKPSISVGERRDNLRGFVLGVFRPDDMLAAALSKLQPEGIDVCLYDPGSPADGRPFPFHASRTRKEAWDTPDADDLNDPKQLHYVAQLGVAGNPWTVACLATPNFVSARRTWWPWGVLAAGWALTLLFAAYLASSIDHKTIVEQLLAEKRLYADQLQDKVRRQTADIRRRRRRSSTACSRPRNAATRRPAPTSAGSGCSAKCSPARPDGRPPTRTASARRPRCTTWARSASPTPFSASRAS